MHKSKLAGFIIDCQTHDVEPAAQFWSSALGMKMEYDPAVRGANPITLF